MVRCERERDGKKVYSSTSTSWKAMVAKVSLIEKKRRDDEAKREDGESGDGSDGGNAK